MTTASNSRALTSRRPWQSAPHLYLNAGVSRDTTGRGVGLIGNCTSAVGSACVSANKGRIRVPLSNLIAPTISLCNIVAHSQTTTACAHYFRTVARGFIAATPHQLISVHFNSTLCKSSPVITASISTSTDRLCKNAAFHLPASFSDSQAPLMSQPLLKTGAWAICGHCFQVASLGNDQPDLYNLG
jgi:hypothetical protein